MLLKGRPIRSEPRVLVTRIVIAYQANGSGCELAVHADAFVSVWRALQTTVAAGQWPPLFSHFATCRKPPDHHRFSSSSQPSAIMPGIQVLSTSQTLILRADHCDVSIMVLASEAPAPPCRTIECLRRSECQEKPVKGLEES